MLPNEIEKLSHLVNIRKHMLELLESTREELVVLPSETEALSSKELKKLERQQAKNKQTSTIMGELRLTDVELLLRKADGAITQIANDERSLHG